MRFWAHARCPRPIGFKAVPLQSHQPSRLPRKSGYPGLQGALLPWAPAFAGEAIGVSAEQSLRRLRFVVVDLHREAAVLDRLLALGDLGNDLGRHPALER